MSKRKKKAKKNKQDSISKNDVRDLNVELLSQAIVKAYYIIEEDKKHTETKENMITNAKEKWYVNVLKILNVFLFPWKINKKFTVNNQIYDGVLVVIVSFILLSIGSISWLLGIVMVMGDAFPSIKQIGGSVSFEKMLLEIFFIVFGSLFVVSGKEFSKVSDSNKIYAYSASIIALIGVVVTIVSTF